MHEIWETGKFAKCRNAYLHAEAGFGDQGLTLKALECKNLVPDVFSNGQSESDNRYEKLSRVCRMILDNCPLCRPLQERSSSLGEEKVHLWSFLGWEQKSEIGY
ncbi:hypothetical protein TNCV_3660171 [Trichonephila clavipes]|nr:hypothetical protein TNCV_3660171 [Trichonephila clavipes]